MIKVDCSSDITKLFVKPLGAGEESSVGLLEDGKHVAKCFHQPKDKYEANNILMGKDLKQSSFCFFEDLYENSNFILGGVARYAPGNKLSKEIQKVSFIDLLYSIALLKRDIRVVSNTGIKVGDWKNFNMNFTDSEISITDVGRCTFSNENKSEICRYNLEMIFGVIKNEYCSNGILKKILEKEEKINRLYKSNENFPEFFIELQRYCGKALNEDVSNLIEFSSKLKK